MSSAASAAAFVGGGDIGDKCSVYMDTWLFWMCTHAPCSQHLKGVVAALEIPAFASYSLSDSG